MIELDGKNIIVNLQCISYGKEIIDWLKELLKEHNIGENIKSAIKQYLNLLSMLTGKLITTKKELNMMLENVNPNELLAIKQLSQLYESSEYRGKLLFKLFEYTQNKFLATDNYVVSNTYGNIYFTKENCKAWFETISKNNLASERNVIGCVLSSKINPQITFLFIVATNHLHYGLVVDSLDMIELEKIKLKHPDWNIRDKWKKIGKNWISHDLGNLRKFSENTLKLLGTDNSYLDDFIDTRLSELDQIIEK